MMNIRLEETKVADVTVLIGQSVSQFSLPVWTLCQSVSQSVRYVMYVISQSLQQHIALFLEHNN